jgi:hypothetical protein
MYNLSLTIVLFFVVNTLFFTVNAKEQINNKLSDTEDGGFFEITTGVIALDSRYIDAPKEIGSVTDLRFRYYWNNFFLEYEGFKGLGFPGVGYNFYNQNAWMLDVFITDTHPAILWEVEGHIESGVINEQDGLAGIIPRQSDNRWSLRATHFIDDTTVLRIIIAPISDLKEIETVSPYLAGWYGKTWQHKNMNFHATLNAQYYNSNILDYYYGIAGDDVSDKFEYYKASSGISLSAEFGIAYPLAKDWLLESSLKFTRLPDSIYHSPLIKTRLESQAQISVTYVIF